MESVDSLIEAIDAFEGAVILATHSEMILHAVAERLIVFEGGKPWLFEGTYGDFLERVGWQDEQAAYALRPDRQAGRKEVAAGREEGAEADARRRSLPSARRPSRRIERQISRLEKVIMEMEERIEADNPRCCARHEVGQGKTIAALSISIHDARKRIEELFGELEAASKEHLARAREFEARLRPWGRGKPSAMDDGPGAVRKIRRKRRYYEKMDDGLYRQVLFAAGVCMAARMRD